MREKIKWKLRNHSPSPHAILLSKLHIVQKYKESFLFIIYNYDIISFKRIFGIEDNWFNNLKILF